MTRKTSIPTVQDIPQFDRRFFESDDVISRIGGGAIGGKASGLAFAHRVLQDQFSTGTFEGMDVSVPRLVVIGTDVFDVFMNRNDLYELIQDDLPDDRIANAFMRAEFPPEFAGDLRGLISAVHTPLALRSSSMLEDAMYEPFAGVYGTKMIPNNQPDIDARYKKLVEAVKFVYASTFFREARAYLKMTGRSTADEKMAVIIQEVVGHRYDERFYPCLSGVARSYNFYSYGHAQPEDGVVDLALGLGKTIVDGGIVWSYCPVYPNTNPPCSMSDLLKSTQTEFWAVNMGKPPAYDPIHETEYLLKGTLTDADHDGSLSMVASTYDSQNDRIVMGIGVNGPRVLDFASTIRMDDIPVNSLITSLMKSCSDELGAAVEIEFAVRVDPRKKTSPRFGFLQVRPMVVSDATIEVEDTELKSDSALLASERVLGNGIISDLTDIVYVKPDDFKKENTRIIASEIDTINRRLNDEGRRYLLIGFGRWGSSDPWLGIPVDWGNISGAQVIVEASLPDMHVELSQGSHFFHNLTSLQLCYFSIMHTGPYHIDWDWLERQNKVFETDFVRHLRIDEPLTVKVDGRHRRGVVLR
jgi:hypothetical protein